jgi:hypothetical protein
MEEATTSDTTFPLNAHSAQPFSNSKKLPSTTSNPDTGGSFRDAVQFNGVSFTN